jgi:uncharacterized protein (TIGR02266 family)
MAPDPNNAGAPPGGPFQNRRRWPRIALELAVRVKFASIAEAIESRTVDISRGGVFIQMREPRPMGTRVNVVMQVADGASLSLSGVVVRSVAMEDLSGPPGIAVVFTDLEEGAKKALDDLLARKLARSSR